MNPGSIMKIMEMKNKFERNHPKVLAFLQREVMSGVPEGSVIEMTITKPGAEPVTANMRVTAEDLEMVEILKQGGLQ
jgi:hypothetical protein